MITEDEKNYYHICPSKIDYEHFELGHINLKEQYRYLKNNQPNRWSYWNGEGHNLDYAAYCHGCGIHLDSELKNYLNRDPHEDDCLARSLIVEKPTGFFIPKFGQIYHCPICGCEFPDMKFSATITTTIYDIIGFMDTYDMIGVVDAAKREHIEGLLELYFIEDEKKDG